MPDNDEKSLEKFRVVILSIKEEKKYQVIKLLTNDLKISYNEAVDILSHLPKEIISSVPEVAADLLAKKLNQLGVTTEVLPEKKGVNYCDFHPHVRAKGRCKRCDKYICNQCILASRGKLICAECYPELLREQKITRIRQGIVITIGIIVLIYAIYLLFCRIGMLSGKYTLKINIVELVPLLDESTKEFFSEFNLKSSSITQENGSKVYNIYDLEEWYQKEYLRFNPNNLNFRYMELSIQGPFQVSEIPKVDWQGEGLIDENIGKIKFVSSLKKIAKSNNISLKDYDHTIFVYFHPDDLRYRAKEGIRVPFSKVSLIYFSTKSANRSHNLWYILHEIGHILGGKDKYIMTSSHGRKSEFPFGYVEPFKEIRYPQQYAELMSGTIPIQTDKEIIISSLDQVRVGHATAYEFGWIKKKEYLSYYRLK